MQIIIVMLLFFITTLELGYFIWESNVSEGGRVALALIRCVMLGGLAIYAFRHFNLP